MIINRKSKNIFTDKASYILRQMLHDPQRKWVLRDFTNNYSISIGMVQAVISTMEKNGYIEWIKKGPKSYFILIDKEQLISSWVNAYDYNFNCLDTYYYSDKKILNKIKILLTPDQYAFTLHTGANFITSYVKTGDIYVYLHLKNWEEDLINIRQQLDLKELLRGGNFHIMKPYYKTGVFLNTQLIKAYSIVSNLQLYLDLYNFQPRGREHAEELKEMLERQGRFLD